MENFTIFIVHSIGLYRGYMRILQTAGGGRCVCVYQKTKFSMLHKKNNNIAVFYMQISQNGSFR